MPKDSKWKEIFEALKREGYAEENAARIATWQRERMSKEDIMGEPKDEEEVEKGICPYCKKLAKKLKKEMPYEGNNVFECGSCGTRFALEKTDIPEKRKRVHCKGCGKLTGKHVYGDMYKCDSCGSQFKHQ